MNTFLWLIRREFWERRAIWLLPAAVGVIVILAALFGQVHFFDPDSPFETRALGQRFLVFFGALFYAIMWLYATLYLLDCLYDDRRDRSILFWKSLPVSDTETVLSKLAVGLLVIPLVCYVAANLTALISAFIISIRAHSLVGAALWQGLVWLDVQVLWAYVIVTSALWYLPVAGWLMLVSAWAKRAVMLWSVLPLLVAHFVERWFFGTHLIGSMLGQRFLGYAPVAFGAEAQAWLGLDESSDRQASIWHVLNAGGFISKPETWIGLLVGAALIFGAIQLRMRRSEA
jgi:ABC-2 type transport system permease protein